MDETQQIACKDSPTIGQQKSLLEVSSFLVALPLAQSPLSLSEVAWILAPRNRGSTFGRASSYLHRQIARPSQVAFAEEAFSPAVLGTVVESLSGSPDLEEITC